MKPVETFFFAFLTASIFYWVPRLFNSCIDIDIKDSTDDKSSSIKRNTEELENIYKYVAWCDKDQFNPLAAHFWSGEGEIIKNIL